MNLNPIFWCVVATAWATSAACSNSTGVASPSIAYRTTSEIREALMQRSLSCEDYSSVSKEFQASDEGTCKIGDSRITLATFSDASGKDEWTKSADTVGCFLAKSEGGPKYIYVQGNLWIAQVDTTSIAHRIANAIGGAVHIPKC